MVFLKKIKEEPLEASLMISRSVFEFPDINLSITLFCLVVCLLFIHLYIYLFDRWNCDYLLLQKQNLGLYCRRVKTNS